MNVTFNNSPNVETRSSFKNNNPSPKKLTLKMAAFANTTTETTPNLKKRKINDISTSTKKIKLEEHTQIKQVHMVFPNIGNSCYINSILQMLFNIPDIITCINNLKDKNTLIEKLNNLNVERTSSKKTMEELRDEIFNRSGNGELTEGKKSQQDAHEFLLFMLDQLKWKPMTTHTCTLTGRDFQTKHYGDEQATNHISVEITADSFQEIMNNHDQAFEEINEPIFLDINGKSQEFNRCKRGIKIKKHPSYLFVHLKKFYISLQNNRISKNNQKISFPQDHLVKIAEQQYEIKGFLNHEGRSPISGHYTADLEKEDGWYHFDDDKSFKQVPVYNTKNPYLVLLKNIS